MQAQSESVVSYLGSLREGRQLEHLLPTIADQAGEADLSRTIAPEVIDGIKATDVMRLSASREIGGVEDTISNIALELEAVAACCSSTSWCLWNHLCVFHFYCGLLGPKGKELLARITQAREWVALPAGAGSEVTGRRDGEDWVVSGRAAFASGARYGEWTGVLFTDEAGTGAKGSAPVIHFGLVRTDAPGVRVDPTWNGMSVRASATDHVDYDNVRIEPLAQGQWIDEYRKIYRKPSYPVVSHRYREDWVGLSTLWLGAQAVGCAQAALEEAAESVKGRVAIFGVKMANRPMVQINLAQAAAKIATARSVVRTGCEETDLRIASATTPTEADYLRQLSLPMMALELCDDAMRLILRTLGGNGLREGGSFERRYRDIQAMPLHINSHRDRVSEQLGRHLLGLDTDNPF